MGSNPATPTDPHSVHVRIHSVGHGARTLDDFLALLHGAGIATLVDIRTAPYSRRHPHFTGDALATAVRSAGLRNQHLKGLGGWRKTPPSSPHAALKEPGFRGYADHLVSPAFVRDYARLPESRARSFAPASPRCDSRSFSSAGSSAIVRPSPAMTNTGS